MSEGEDLAARLAAIEALLQQTILRMASQTDPDFGDIVEGTADQMVQSIDVRMKQGPKVLEQVERILAPVRKEAAANRSRREMQMRYRDFDD